MKIRSTRYHNTALAGNALLILACSLAVVGVGSAQDAPSATVQIGNQVEIQGIAPNIVRIHVKPDGKTTPRTLVIDPALKLAASGSFGIERSGAAQILSSSEMRVVAEDSLSDSFSVQVQNGRGKTLLTIRNDGPKRARPAAAGERVPGPFSSSVMIHDEQENLYGIRGTELEDNGAGILRNAGGKVAAGVQGGAGGPFFFTTSYAVLVDSDGGTFQTRDEQIHFHGSRADTEYFVIVGSPLKSLEGLALLTGKPPMPPKWTVGFLDSQWVSTEDEWRQLTTTFEKEGIPVSGYIFDFDWKAWGEDDYGEWRWNSTSGKGNAGPDKFPTGASGKFAADMLEHGVHLGGILKPRILVNRADGKPTQASQYATDHHFWYPDEIREDDYVTHWSAATIDFSNPEARRWYWQHLEPAFRAGMTGWWNDEADFNTKMVFNNFQFMNMGRALYEGQRSVSSERVWSINRAYYIGASRYGYAEWSGDIVTGFQSMAYQRRRMVSTLNLGESAWGMDAGGFIGHPTSENYARWVEFAAFVPIFRVHGQDGEKRQPWVYGPVAEAAAKKAIRMRYAFMPYIYSNARMATETGIGIVRPLFWEFSDDQKCADETRAWMFGDALLVSPIVEHGLKTHAFYLPAGIWLDYASGKPVTGGREISVPVDSATWQDIPIYVRKGSIFATQPETAGNELRSKTPLVLDIFPSDSRVASFAVYDDDGHTYNYENGEYFRQEVTAKASPGRTDIEIGSSTGTFVPSFSAYELRAHYASRSVSDGRAELKRFPSDVAFAASTEPGWVLASDRFGPMTKIRLPLSKESHSIVLSSYGW